VLSTLLLLTLFFPIANAFSEDNSYKLSSAERELYEMVKRYNNKHDYRLKESIIPSTDYALEGIDIKLNYEGASGLPLPPLKTDEIELINYDEEDTETRASPSLSVTLLSSNSVRLNYTFPNYYYPAGNLAWLWNMSQGKYDWMSSYGINSGSTTINNLVPGHRYEAAIQYYNSNGTWTGASWVFFTLQNKFSTTLYGSHAVIKLYNGYIPVTLLFDYQFRIGTDDNYYGPSVNVRYIDTFADHSAVPPYLINEFAIQIMSSAQSDFWRQEYSGSWTPYQGSYYLYINNNVITVPNRPWLYRMGNSTTLPSGIIATSYYSNGLPNAIKSYRYAYYGNATFFVSDGFSNLTTVGPIGDYTYFGW